jgi:hypothetical protein
MKFDQNFDLAIRSSLHCWSSLLACFPSNEQAYLRILSSFQAISALSSQKTFGARLAHPSYTQVIITVVLAINDKHTLSVKHANNLVLPINVILQDI